MAENIINKVAFSNFMQIFHEIPGRILPKLMPSAYATIFMLHRMHDPEIGSQGHTAEELRNSLSQLKKEGCTFVPLEQLMRDNGANSLPDSPLISFTVDDGFVDQARIAGPIFAEFDCPATFFLISGFLDRKLWPWDAQVDYIFRHCRKKIVDMNVLDRRVRLYFQSTAHRNASRRAFREFCKTLPNSELDVLLPHLSSTADVELPADAPMEYLPMSWANARELQKSGIRFAPHTVSHRIVSKMTDEEANYEIVHSITRVVEELGECDKVFAWPNGKNVDFGKRERNILSNLGFLGSVHTEPILVPLEPTNHEKPSLAEWGRLSLPKNNTEIIRTVSQLGKLRLLLMQRVDVRYGGKRGLITLLKGMIARVIGRHRQFGAIEWGRVRRLVFLCTGNICRSAYAEAYALSHKLPALSCGINALTHSTANHTAIQVAESRGVRLFAHRSTNVDDVKFEPTDLVLAFDMSHVDRLQSVKSTFGCQTSLLGIWGSVPGNVLPDPFGCSGEFFHRSFERIEKSVNKIQGLMCSDSELI